MSNRLFVWYIAHAIYSLAVLGCSIAAFSSGNKTASFGAVGLVALLFADSFALHRSRKREDGVL